MGFANVHDKPLDLAVGESPCTYRFVKPFLLRMPRWRITPCRKDRFVACAQSPARLASACPKGDMRLRPGDNAFLAHRVIWVPRNYWVAFGVKRTSTLGKVTKPDL
jgi:hypothetical protein